MKQKKEKKESLFTPYQVFIIAIVAFIQFTVILDFMIMSPLSPYLLNEWKISTSQFGFVVSAYAFSAGISGLLSAGFADRFDRKKFLMFFYTGFLIGTALCAMAPNYPFLLIARIITGIFGGVIGSVGAAIITDIFRYEVRGRVMAYVQSAFAASQVLGIPLGLWLAEGINWHWCFWMIVICGAIVGFVILVYMKPVDSHLEIKSERNAVQHLAKTISHPDYIRAFLGTVLLATGGFMLMPFGAAFSTNNLGLKMTQLKLLYLITGVFSILCAPIIGRMSDKAGRFRTFLAGTIISILMVAVYTQLGITPLWIIILLNVILFIGINSRIISSSALISAIPDPQDRGAFMSINSSIQMISGGVASGIAGLIVVQSGSGMLEHYDMLGYAVIGSMTVAAGMIYMLDRFVLKKQKMREMEAQETPLEPTVTN